MRVRAAVIAALPVLLLPLCWLPSYLLGGENGAPPLLVFAAVIVAATRGSYALTVLVAVLAMLAAGPLMPADVDAGVPQGPIEWLVRGAYFIAGGLGMTAAVRSVRRRALHDPLTRLPNRRLLAEHLDVALARARRTGRAVALAYVDLDDFKVVNDDLGHAAGDRLLAEVARRLRGCVRDTDVVARQGGDEFLVLLADLDDARVAGEAVRRTFERIRTALDEPIAVGGAELRIGVSMGASIFPEDAADADALHRHADAAMYRAKQGGGGLAHHAETRGPAPIARLSLAARLRRGIDAGELELHYQPIWDMDGGGIRGMESLVRWHHPRRGLVPPSEFIAIAEQTGVIDTLGEWVIRETCRQARVWQDLGVEPRFGVNVSPYQLRRPGFAAHMSAIVEEYGLDLGRFIVELTESAWMLDADRTRPVLDELRDAGFVLALDDFGAGYSSLARLVDLPLQVVKVDRQFLSGVPERRQAVDMFEAIVHIARTSGCDVVAEGIETPEQRDAVIAAGCPIGQGFGLAEPMPGGKATALLLEHMLQSRRVAPVTGAHAQAE